MTDERREGFASQTQDTALASGRATPQGVTQTAQAIPVAGALYITDAEREFVRELADWLIRWQRSFPMTSTMMDACRRLLEAE